MAKIKFGTDGWRAIIAEDWTFHNLSLVTTALAHFLLEVKKKDLGIIVGYDTRFMSEEFAKKVSEILSSFNIPTYLTERDTPTPVVAFQVLKKKTAGAVMLTASHNPPEYAGFKFIPWYAGPALPDITDRIEEKIRKISMDNLNLGDKPRKSAEFLQDKSHRYKVFNPAPEYIKHLLKLVKKSEILSSNLKIVYDAMFSTGRDYVDKILKELGMEVTVIHNNRDCLFGGRLPDPNLPNLRKLQNLVVKTGADVGLATDGDADRFGIIGSGGEYYTPNQIISLLAYHLIKNKKKSGVIVRTVATTHMLNRLGEKYNLPVEEVPVGFKYISEILREKQGLIGGEESGGLSIQGHIPEKDGILACLLIVEMLSLEKKPLSQVYKEMIKEIGPSFSKRLDIHLSKSKKEEVLTKLKNKNLLKIGEFKIKEKILLDGVKFIFADDSWLLARPSGTEPLIRFYAEATSSSKLKRLVQEVNKIIK